MRDDHLPTVDDMLGDAAQELDFALQAAEAALAHLRSDWQPADYVPTAEQAATRMRLRNAATTVKKAVEAAREGR